MVPCWEREGFGPAGVALVESVASRDVEVGLSELVPPVVLTWEALGTPGASWVLFSWSREVEVGHGWKTLELMFA